MKPQVAKNGPKLAYDYLCTQILVDPSRQGTFLSEQDLADEIGISRTPVREALRILASEGLVEKVPHRGTYIPDLTQKQILDVMELREILELHAISTVLKNDIFSTKRMREILEAQYIFLSDSLSTDPIEFMKLDREFHFELLKQCHNDVIIRTYDQLGVRQRVMGAQALYARDRWEEVYEEHLKILETLESGSVEQAQQATKSHLQETTAVLLKKFFK